MEIWIFACSCDTAPLLLPLFFLPQCPQTNNTCCPLACVSNLFELIPPPLKKVTFCMEIAEENKKVFLLGDNVCVGEGGGGGGGGGGGFGCTFTFPEQKKNSCVTLVFEQV